MNSTFVNGLKIYSFKNRRDLIHFAAKEKKCLVAVNAEKILNATDRLRDLININIGYPDGIGAVWALKKKGVENCIKIPGCELWLDIIKEFNKEKTFYLVGSKQEVIDQVVFKLKTQYPGIKILNYRNGFLSDQTETEILINDIAIKKPDVVFVAMGSPKQEILIQEMQKKHSAIYQGLGGSFDVYSGHVNRAPQWWIDNNLEWAYRLIKQPFRIKRQVHLLKFLTKLLLKGI